jgi:hypothetical protein
VEPLSAQTLVDWRLGERGNMFNGVCTEANSVKGAEAADFFLYSWYLKSLRMTEFDMYQGALTISRKTLD